MPSLWPLTLIAFAIGILQFVELMQMFSAKRRRDWKAERRHFQRVIVASACNILVAICTCIVVLKK